MGILSDRTRRDSPDARDSAVVTSRSVSPGRAVVAGMLAAALALAVSVLLDGLVAAVPSLVVAVGDWVIDNAPSAVEQWAIATLGTADKPALITGIVVLSLAIGAGLGVGAARHLWVGMAGLAAFGLFGLWTAAVEAPLWAAALTAVVSAAAGMAALWWLLARARTPQKTAEVKSEAESLGRRGPRRVFLRAAGATAATAIVSAGVGRYLLGTRRVVASRADASLPPPAAPAPDPTRPVSFDVDGLDPWVTPNEQFYRIDTALRVPRVEPATWHLAITGMVDNPYQLTYDELLSMPLEEHYITLACVSNEVGGELVDNARWFGARLDAVLERAGVQQGASQVVGRSVDGFSAGFPTEVAFDGRDALVAVGMNGEPLPAEHGFPARLVVPGLFGYVSATKWLSEIELTTLEDFDGYWIPRGWAKFGPIVTQSQIDVPRPGATVPAGSTAVAGIAYAPTRGIARVEVQVDAGPWQRAELAAPYNEDTWRQWLFRWDAQPGTHTLTVRATDGNEEVQTAEVSPVAPDGATGLHTVPVTVV